MVVAAFIGVAYITMPSLTPGTSLFLQPSDAEHAFIQFIAKYGKSYAAKSELPKRFEAFQKNYEMV